MKMIVAGGNETYCKMWTIVWAISLILKYGHLMKYEDVSSSVSRWTVHSKVREIVIDDLYSIFPSGKNDTDSDGNR